MTMRPPGAGNCEPADGTPETTLDLSRHRVESWAEHLDLLHGDVAEARADDDRLRQPAHLAHQLHGLCPEPPAIEQLGHSARDDRGEIGMMARVEGRGDLSSPVPPWIAVHHREAPSEEGAHSRGGRSLLVRRCLVLEHVFDVIGMPEQDRAMGSEPHRHHVAVAAHTLREEPEGIAARAGKYAQDGIAGGTRRRAEGGHVQAARRACAGGGA